MKTYPRYPQVEKLRREAEEVVRGFNKATRSLFRDSIPKYSDERMAELQRHYRGERNKALKSIEEAAERLAQEARREAELAQESFRRTPSSQGTSGITSPATCPSWRPMLRR